MYADTLDIRDLASEWREVVEEMEANVPDTEGMSYGELIDATAAFIARPEQTELVAKYVSLCEDLGIDPTPDALEAYGDHEEPTLIAESYFTEYAQELAEELFPFSPNSAEAQVLETWPYRCIDWEWAARELKYDYTTVRFDGTDYYIRSV